MTSKRLTVAESPDDKRIRFDGLVRREWVNRILQAVRQPRGPDTALWYLIARGILRELWPERLRPIAQRRGLPPRTLWLDPDPHAHLEEWLRSATLEEGRVLIVEMLIDDVSYKPGPPPNMLALAGYLFGVPVPVDDVEEYLEALDE